MRRHQLRFADNPAYAELVARVLRSATRRSIPLPANPLALPARVRVGADEPLIIQR